MNNEKKQLQDEISEMEELLNDSSTPADIKPAIKEGIDKAKGLLKELEVAQQVPAPKPVEVKKQEKKIIDQKTAMQKAAEITKGHKPAAKPVVTKQVKADAVKKAKAVVEKISKKKVVKAKKKISTAVTSLKKLVSRAKELAGYKGMSESDLQRDAGRRAKRPGKRVSASGEVYYENRANRTDVNRKKFPFLEKGGSINEDLYVAGITDAQKAKLKVIFEKFAAKDYWGYKYELASKLEYWKKLIAAKDESAMKYAEQDIRDSFNAQERIAFAAIVNSLYKFITEKNVQKLKDRVRYDQKVSLEVYEVLTGESLKGKSNKELIEYFKKKYEAGSFEKGGQLKYKNGKDVPFSIYGSGGEYFIKDNNSNNTLPSSTVSYWTGNMNKFSSKKQANDALIKMLKKMHEEQPGYNPKFEAGGKVEDIKKGSLVFVRNIGQKGLVGLVVSDKYQDKELECDVFDVYFRGLMGEVHPVAEDEIVDVRQSSLHNAIQNGDIDAYYSIAGKKGFEINPIYKEMSDEDEMTDEWDGERRNGEDSFKKGGLIHNNLADFEIKYNNKKETGHHANIVQATHKKTKELFTHYTDQGREGHEYYKGENYGGTGRSYSRHYNKDQYPAQYKNIYQHLEKLHKEKYGAGSFEKGGRIDDPEKDGPYTLDIYKSKLSLASKVSTTKRDIETYAEAKKQAVELIEAGNYLVYIYSNSGYLWAATKDRIESFENGGQVDNTFNYMMLSRLQSDCEYFLNYGGRSERHLREGNVDAHIKEMKRLWNMLEVKPEWLSMEQIEDYEKKMKNKFEKGDVMEDDPFITKYQKYNNTQKGEFKSGDKVTVRWMGDNVVGEIIEHIPETVAQNGGFRHTYFIKLPGVTEPQRFFQNAILGSENEFEKGGVVKYEGKTPKQIWELWDLNQRLHFLHDHVSAIQKHIEQYSKMNYEELPHIVKVELISHTKGTQYEDGGELKKEMKEFWYVTDSSDNVKSILAKKEDADTFAKRISGSTVHYTKVPLKDWEAEKIGVSNIKNYAKMYAQSYEKGGKLNSSGNISHNANIPNPRYVGTKVYIGFMRNRYFLIDVKLNEKWSNDSMKTKQEAIDFAKENAFDLVSDEVSIWNKKDETPGGSPIFTPPTYEAGIFEKGGQLSTKEKVEKYVHHYMNDDMSVIFDTIGMDMPTELEGDEYENTMDEARDAAIKHYTEHPEDMTDKFGNPFKFEKGGIIDKENLIKELHKLQKELNSSRLSTYTEGDNSEQELNRQNERKVKIARFNEILKVLNDGNNVNSKGFEKGGQLSNEYTAGKWFTEIFDNKESNHVIYTTEKPEGIANVYMGKESEANAKLIVAAPELLEACKRALSWFYLNLKKCSKEPACLSELIAAIESATGTNHYEQGGQVPEQIYSDVFEHGGVIDESRIQTNVYNPGTAGNPGDKYLAQIRYKGFVFAEEKFDIPEQAQSFLDNYDKSKLVTKANDQEASRRFKNLLPAERLESGGRLLSARNRDRAYQSQEPWEQRYKRTTRPRHPKYSFAAGGKVEYTNESFYDETPNGGTYGINCKESDQVKLAVVLGSKSIDNYIPLPGVPMAEQVKRIKETGNLTDSKNPTYWESEDGSHGWCDKHTGQVFQWG